MIMLLCCVTIKKNLAPNITRTFFFFKWRDSLFLFLSYKMDVDRAISMLKALPYMSETIVDDTLYEKVLSFLTLVFSTHNLSILKPHVVTNIQAACDMADYRVTALSIRILGQWVHYSHDFDIPPTLLKVILDGITSSEASLRCACLESCRLFISCDQGKSWVAQHDERLSPVTLLDQSSYVVAEACRLFSTVLHVPELMTKMDPSALVLSLLRPQADQKQILSALDLCWELVSVQNQVALEYLRTRKLVMLAIRVNKWIDVCVYSCIR